jgi:ABC-type sugar transport system ATPase subunit
LGEKVILEIRGFSKHFGGIQAISDIDLKIYEHEIVAIVGDNGAGKSTLINCISGVYHADSGKIFINGEESEVHNPNDSQRHGIETLYQSEGLIPSFDTPANLFLGREKLQDNLLGNWFGFLDGKYMKRESENLLNKFQIQVKDLNTEVNNLSGGQRQAVAVGRAVYWGKKIVILDEPTNNLGVNEQKSTIKLIRQLRDEYDMSVIIITHNLFHVFELVDRIIVLKNGRKVGERIKEEATTEEIVTMITGA